MPSEAVRLEACPFCGGSRMIVSAIRDGAEVRCLTAKCGAAVHRFRPDAERKAIAAWNHRPASPGWEAIETAPKDGTRIMAAYCMENEEWRFLVVFWNVFEGHGFWQFGGFEEHPTHWQPLPSAPGHSQ